MSFLCTKLRTLGNNSKVTQIEFEKLKLNQMKGE